MKSKALTGTKVMEKIVPLLNLYGFDIDEIHSFSIAVLRLDDGDYDINCEVCCEPEVVEDL